MLGGGGDVAGSIKAGDGTPSLMDDLAIAVSEQADRGGAGRMQLDAIERRLLDRAETRVEAARRLRARELPLVLSAAEVRIGAAPGEAVESLRRAGERIGVDAKPGGELRQRCRARHGLGHLAADRLVGERELLEILRIEDQKGGQIRI